MWRVFFIAGILGLMLSSCMIENQDPFVRKVEAERFTKDSFLKFSVESPIPPQDRKGFVRLNYFEPRPEYIVKADVEMFAQPQSIIMKDSRGDQEEYLRMGKLTFRLKDSTFSLAFYQRPKFLKDEEYKNQFFLPFFDKTNEKETYHGGRFMDVDYHGEDSVIVDFNAAYNPYCAYTYEYTCPVPPMENYLPTRIEAGELRYQ